MEKIITSKVRLLREALGWTLLDVSDRATVDYSYLSLIETGRRHPSPRVAQRIADALGLAVSDLFTSLEPEKRNRKEDVSHAETPDATRSL